MSVVGHEPTAPKITHHFDPNSLEDLTACVSASALQCELNESRNGLVIDTYEVFGHRLSREHEPALRACAADSTRYTHYMELVLSIVGEPNEDEQYDSGLLDDRLHDIGFTLGKLSAQRQVILRMEDAEVVEAATETGFALASLLTNNPAADYVVAVIKNSRLASGATALRFT